MSKDIFQQDLDLLIWKPTANLIGNVLLSPCRIKLLNKETFYTYQTFADNQGSVVRRPDSAIYWIAIFSTFLKLPVDRYNLRLRFGIYKLKFLRSIVGSRCVVLQLFG